MEQFSVVVLNESNEVILDEEYKTELEAQTAYALYKQIQKDDPDFYIVQIKNMSFYDKKQLH